MISLLSVTACSKDNEETGKATKSPKETSSSSVQPTLEPTPEPKNPNVLNLSGYEYYDNEDEKQQDFYLAALYSNKVADKDENIDFTTILGVTDDSITVDCALRSETSSEEFEGELEYSISHKIVSLDRDTLKLNKEITVDGNKYFVEDKKEVFVLSSIADKSASGIIYDNDLNMVGEYNLEGYDGVFVNSSGKQIYCVKNKALIKYDVASGETSDIKLNKTGLIDYIGGVLTTADNSDYLIVNMLHEDFQYHQTIINAQNGEIKYICSDENSFSSIDNDVFYIGQYGEMGVDSWIIAYDEKNQWKYLCKDTDFNKIILDNGDVMFTTTKDDVVIMEVYDNEQGRLIDKQEIKIPCSEIKDTGYDGEMLYRANVVDIPKYLDEDTLLVTINNIDSETRYFIWNLDDNKEQGNAKVEKYKTGTCPSKVITASDITLYTPGELSEELKPLKERADKMEEEYGVEVYIGEECGNYSGGYSSAPYLGYENVEDALDKLEYALAKYPKGFFAQFNDSYTKGLHVYLAGELRGVEDDVLDLAGGFKASENYKIVLYINCDFVDMIESTFHHELCHAIDEKICNADIERDNPLLSDEIWDKFNPKEGMYTFTYDEYGFDGNHKYVYDLEMYDSLSDVYFIDSYAMTYPTEDRARLFEAIMGEAYTYMEFEKTPNLQEKIEYFSECMRQTFDTTGWEDVHWERFNRK